MVRARGKHKLPITPNKRLELKMTDEERIYDGLQEVKNSIGKLDDTLRTKIFYELSETNDFLIRY
ncbi:MAG: hypothetical protein GEU26_18705 [Nitrososphaeraceae archaeon]|nr:hypothetical protein [Nitrososphaeraceae archaeon]